MEAETLLFNEHEFCKARLMKIVKTCYFRQCFGKGQHQLWTLLIYTHISHITKTLTGVYKSLQQHIRPTLCSSE